MKKLMLPALLLAVACAEAAPRTPEQSTAPKPAEKPPVTQTFAAVSGERAFEDLRQMVSIGPRPAGSAGIQRTRAFITRQIEAIGLKTQEQAFLADTPFGKVAMSNLIVTLPGTRPERILITSHYDTKPIREFVFVGANDGGSSTALLIELARVLKDKPREYTYELVFFDGEEAWGEWTSGNTWGSRYYVDAAKKAGTLSGVKAMILLDMIGGRGLEIRQDTNSTPWLNDIFWRAAGRLNHTRTFLAETTAVEDDHFPFKNAGVPVIDLIDLTTYEHWHKVSDTLDKVDPQSMKIVGDVVVAALPMVEARLKSGR